MIFTHFGHYNFCGFFFNLVYGFGIQVVAMLMGEQDKVCFGHFRVIRFPADRIDVNDFAFDFHHQRSVTDECERQIAHGCFDDIFLQVL